MLRHPVAIIFHIGKLWPHFLISLGISPPRSARLLHRSTLRPVGLVLREANMSEATQGNPYAGPDSQAVDPNCKGVWRDEGSLIARDRFARFPAKCIVCGDKNDCRPVKCTVRIRPGLAFFFIPVLAAFSPSVSISPYMCTTHRRRDQLYRWIGHAIALTAACALFGPFIIMGIVDGAPVELMFLTPLAVLLWPVRIFRLSAPMP